MGKCKGCGVPPGSIKLTPGEVAVDNCLECGQPTSWYVPHENREIWIQAMREKGHEFIPLSEHPDVKYTVFH